MAKKKGAIAAPASAQQATGAPSQAESGKSADKSLSLFPPKPERLSKAPGTPVQLISNLFKISLKQEKPIYRFTIEIDQLDAQPSSGDGKKPALPRKISKDIRQMAVKKAVGDWLVNNDRGKTFSKLDYSFVLDANASTMFALFNMPLATIGETSKKRLDIEVTIAIDFCSKNGLVKEDKKFLVRFHDGFQLNVRELLDYCSGKGVQNTQLYQDHIRALNVIFMAQIISDERFFASQSAKSGFGSMFNYDRRHQFPLSAGILCNKGFNLSVRPTECGIVLNVANTVAPFYEPLTILDLLQKRFRVTNFNQNLRDFERQSLEKELNIKQVEATHINYGTPAKPHYRKYRVQGISKTSAASQMFDSDGVKMSVFNYFKATYPKLNLKFPNLPCIVDRGRYIPIEVCRLVDRQRVNRKLTPDETSNVIRQAALKPDLHFKHVEENAKEMASHNKSYGDFGFGLDMKPIEVTGRELPQIRLVGISSRDRKSRVPTTTANGEYPTRDMHFVRPVVVSRWSLLILLDNFAQRQFSSPADCESRAREFIELYAKAGWSKGVTIQPTNTIKIMPIQGKNDLELKRELIKHFDELNSANIEHCIAVLPQQVPDGIYGYLQFLEVTRKGTRQANDKRTRVSCLKFDNYLKKILNESMFNRKKMFLDNLWLKHNTKLGGVNAVLDQTQTFNLDPKTMTNFLSPGYLFVSIDVCHPAPGDRLMQSVAAAVGMWNITNPLMSYCTRLRVQRKERSDQDKSTVEEVGEIGFMFKDILESFIASNKGKAPSHVVILRDGVSEGQFKMVLYKELVQILQVISNLSTKLKVPAPKLACLTVQKRHKVRFMRKEPIKDRRNMNDYNIQPGTVVDSTVTMPNDFSFYLAPHKAIQGTARAPHIYMIYDEIKFNQDSAQAMIFALSYLSPRCTKGTSIPTPVNLADLAAERGKNLVIAWNEANSDKKLSDSERLIQLNAFLGNLAEPAYKNGLFYI